MDLSGIEPESQPCHGRIITVILQALMLRIEFLFLNYTKFFQIALKNQRAVMKIKKRNIIALIMLNAFLALSFDFVSISIVI